MTTEIKEARVWDRQAVLDLINGSNLAAGKALWGLYQRQTSDEKATNETREHNSRGFNGRDANFLSSIAQKLPTYGYTMTERQLPHVRRKLAKYTRQLLEIIEEKGGKVDYKTPKTKQAPVENQVQVSAPIDDRAQFGLF